MKKLILTFLIILFTLTSNVVWSGPGFKDLQPGMPANQVGNFCSSLKKAGSPPRFPNQHYAKCYGIDNIKFRAFGGKTLKQLSLDMGPIVSSDGSFFSILNNLVIDPNNEPNIYLKMKKNFDDKYVLDYEYSERDRQLFNESEKKYLIGVYSNGQVVLRIWRKERDNSYSKDLWLYIEYRDVKSGKQFLEKNRPVRASLDDF